MNWLTTGIRAIELALLIGLCVFISTLSYMAGADKTELAAVQRELVTERGHLTKLKELQAGMSALELRAAQSAARVRALQQSQRQELTRYAQEHRDDGCRLDADGLRLWRRANAQAHPGSERDTVDPAGLPAAPAAGGRLAPGAAGEPHGSDRAVPGVPGQAPGAGAGDLPARGSAAGAVS